MGGYAWVTLATNDSYSLGALVLAHSLRRVGSQHDLVVLITPGVSQSMREKLMSVFTLVREVNVLDSKDEANLDVLQRPELGITFTKLHCWRLTQYDKCVFIDADALVVKNCDELFEREELSAAPDVGWPDCFNSGVFVFKPSQQTFALLIQFAASHGSFDGADQGLLNMYFSDWAHKDISKHLPFIYNMCSVASYSYAPAFNVYGKNVRIVHFIGATKPWLQYFDTLTGVVQPPANCGHVQPLLQVWWNIFYNNVQSELSGEMGGLAGTLSRLTIGEVRAEDQKAIEDHIRKQNWEQGQIDYMGKDSFDNILKKINETVELASLEKTSAVEEIQQPKKTGSKDSEVEAAVEKSEIVLPEIEDEPQSQKIQLPTEDGLTSTKNAEAQIESTSVTEVKEIDGTNLQQMTILTQNIVDLIKSTDGFQITDQLTQTVTPSVVLMPDVLDVKQPKSLKQNIDAESIQQVTETSPEAVINTIVSNISLSSILSESQSEKSDETVQINETLNVPETVTECPVPIQVAESVLQAEPKESVSENQKSTADEVTSTISSLKKSAVADTDTLSELKQTDLSQCSSISPPLNSEKNFLKTEENKNVTLLTLDTTLVASNSKIASAVSELSQITQEEIQSSEKSQLPSEVAAQIEEVPVREAESGQETAKLVQPISPQCVEEITELPKVNLLAPKETQLPMQNTQTLVQEVQSVEVETGSALQETGLTSLEPQSGMQKMELTSQETIPEPEDGSCILQPDESISQKSKLTVKLPQQELIKEHTLTKNKDLTTNLNRSFEGEILEKKDSKMKSPTEIDESLVESNTLKDIKVPGTPIVIEPTPPTSPPFEIKADQVTEEKTHIKTKKETEVEKQIEVLSTEPTEAQKIEKLDQLKQESDSEETTGSAVKTEEKKSSAESDSPSSPEIEGTSKSIGNSNVKKVSKKPNESEEAKESSSIDKPTKIPKTAKKLTKTPSSTSLDADRSVPETPPPSGAATSQVPVPPKRKTKNNSSTKTSSKK